MEDLKAIIAENITQLRRANGMTQAGLAEKLNYTDKAVSKWERRESLPDITVLKAIADCFGVTVDYLITAEHKDTKQEAVNEADEKMKLHTKNRGFITGMSILLVWLIACTAFIVINALDGKSCVHWLTFIYASDSFDVSGAAGDMVFEEDIISSVFSFMLFKLSKTACAFIPISSKLFGLFTKV